MYIISEFQMEIDKFRVFSIMECSKDSPVYDEVNYDYYFLLDVLYSYTEPKGIFQFFDYSHEAYSLPVNCEKVVLAILSLGKQVENQIFQLFDQGDYLKGMLLDIMADELLFNLSNQLDDLIFEEAQKMKLGLTRRLSPGEMNIPIEHQKLIFDRLEASELLKMSISEGYMLDPVKSTAFLRGADPGIPMKKNTHDCSQCNLKDCKYKGTY